MVTKKQKKSKQTAVVPDAERKNLRQWNLRLGIVLLVQAVILVVVAGSQTVSVTQQYVAKDALASEAAGHEVLAMATRHLFDVHLSWIVAKFLVIFGVIFLLAATLLRKRYEAWLERGVNKLRWLGLGLGGGSIVVTMAMLGGVTDLAVLLIVFGSVVLAALLALSIELLGPERRLACLLAVGAIAAAVLPWLLVLSGAAGVVLFNGALPGFVWFTYLTTLLFFVALGLAAYLRHSQRGKWANAIYAEKMFMMVSFAAASVLAWQIFAGALQP